MWIWIFPVAIDFERNTRMTLDDVRLRGEKVERDFIRANHKADSDNVGEKVFRYVQSDAGSIIHKILYILLPLFSMAALAYSFFIPSFAGNSLGLFIGFFLCLAAWIAVLYCLVNQMKVRHEMTWYMCRLAVRNFCIAMIIYAVTVTLLTAADIALMLGAGEQLAGANLYSLIAQGTACLAAWLMWIIEKCRRIAVI